MIGGKDTAQDKLVVEGVSKWFRTPRASVQALDAMNLRVAEG